MLSGSRQSLSRSVLSRGRTPCRTLTHARAIYDFAPPAQRHLSICSVARKVFCTRPWTGWQLVLPGLRHKRSIAVMAGTGPGCERGSHDLEDAPAFCIPGDRVHCKGCRWNEGSKKCYRMECDALFTPKELRQQQRGWKREGPPQLIITAGPERSGSTWLYNAVRLIFEDAQQPLDAYWLTNISDGALDVRGAGQPHAHHMLIKTHVWSADWDIRRATHIFIIHRDLRQVVRSYRRMGWASNLPRSYVEDHMHWRERAELDIAFEDIVTCPHALVQDLAARLALEAKVDANRVVHALNSLPTPTDFVDPVTQMWPNHLSQVYMEERARSANGTATQGQQPSGTAPEQRSSHSRARASSSQAASLDYLKQRHPEFFALYINSDILVP